MFEKMKQLAQMQKQVQEMKRQLDAASFEVASSDGQMTISINGSQELLQVSLADAALTNKAALEKS